MRFRLKAGTGIPGRGPPLEEGEPETLKKLRLQDKSLPFLLRSSFCGRIRLPETRLYPKIDRGPLAGVVRFELTNVGTKIPCLTAWRNPIEMYLRKANYCYRKWNIMDSNHGHTVYKTAALAN